MTKLNGFAASLMAAALFTGASFVYAQSSPTGNQQQQSQYTVPANGQVEDWNTPPPGTEQAQQGFRDGVEAAKLDKLAHRPIDPKVSHLYVHPPVKKDAQADYRTAFENGYKKAVQNQGM